MIDNDKTRQILNELAGKSELISSEKLEWIESGVNKAKIHVASIRAISKSILSYMIDEPSLKLLFRLLFIKAIAAVVNNEKNSFQCILYVLNDSIHDPCEKPEIFNIYSQGLLTRIFQLITIINPRFIPCSRSIITIWFERKVINPLFCELFESCFIDPTLTYAMKTFSGKQWDKLWTLLAQCPEDLIKLEFLELNAEQMEVIDSLSQDYTRNESDITEPQPVSEPNFSSSLAEDLKSELSALFVKCERIDGLTRNISKLKDSPKTSITKLNVILKNAVHQTNQCLAFTKALFVANLQ